MGWIGVDLDGTLAKNHGQGTMEIGEPIPAMVERVKQWLQQGQEVRIFTARVSHPDYHLGGEEAIQNWCLDHIGIVLKVTNIKTWDCWRIWDDRAVAVEFNTGRILGGNNV